VGTEFKVMRLATDFGPVAEVNSGPPAEAWWNRSVVLENRWKSG
jgi:hypothetical protein